MTQMLQTFALPVLLLVLSNVFMTFAWYYHLSHPWLRGSALWVAVLVSWGIALAEYCFQVPANRLGHARGIDVPTLKVLQAAITLGVFLLFYLTVMRGTIHWNHLVGFGLVVCGVVVVFAFNPPAVN